MIENLNRHQRVRALFERISALPAPARAAALAEACVNDDSLHDEVGRLLAADAAAGSFLERGVALNATDSARLIGQRVGPYEVQALIGVGGMGEVYRARDTTLGRDVALKILPDAFVDDADRVARFRREAQILASLNHPHIAAIYGFEEWDSREGSGQDAVPALVLELVDGPTLADRIARGPVPFDEAVAIARQIVDALEAAHRQGVIHRDLKPANIKLRPEGTVKVLDFGLAKALEPRSGDADTPRSPAHSSPLTTRLGTVLGTPTYMSPEQAKGQPTDARSDVWAFGCVLFEMFAGRPAFQADTIADTLSLALTKDPDWTRLPATLSPSIRRLLRRCLEKDRKRRLADIADARLELDDVHDTPLDDSASMQSNARTKVLGWLPALIVGAAAGGVLSLASVAVLNRPAPDPEVYRSSILFPGRLGPLIDSRGANIALSPDGRRLAFVATDSTGRTQLWLRALDTATAQPVADTEGARTPFWSPDSRWVGFVAYRALKKVDASGGLMVTLSGAALSGGSWSHDGVILFTTTNNTLARVDAMGGTATGVTTIGADTEWAHVSPSFLPDGRHFIYAATSGSGLWSSLGVYVASIDSGERTRLPVDAAYVQYAHGFLWYARGSTLMAQPFDAEARRITGNAVPVAEQLHAPRTITMSAFSVSPAGALVYQTNPSPGYELTWFDRAGRRTGTVGTRDDYADLRLSPDGRRALVSVGEPDTKNRDLWMFDLARGVRTRFTSGPEPEMHSSWSPDGTRVVFDSQRGGRWGLFQKLSNGVGDIETILADGFDNNRVAWSPDGRFLLFTRREAETFNVWVLPLEGDRKPFPFTRSAVSLPSGFSPDGRWVVYMSRDSGRGEVYVAPFPGPGPRVLVSTAGGWDATWRRDGKEIMYLDLTTNTLMSAAVTTDGGRFDVHDVKPLFPLAKVGPRSTYDITADGQRILAVTEDDEATRTPLTLVLNWPALLKR